MNSNFQIEILKQDKKSDKDKKILENEITFRIPEEFQKIISQIKTLSEDVYSELGTGFSEHIYHRSLEVALRNSGVMYETKKIIPIHYKGINVGYGEADIIIHHNSQIIILELKAVTNSPREIEVAQVKTYLRSIEKSDIGIIINFPQPGTKLAKENIDFKIVEK